MALRGFHLGEETEITVPGDEDPKTVFVIRNLPSAKKDEIEARAFDFSQKERLAGADVIEKKAYCREVVRWGVARHTSGFGGLAECQTVEAELGGQKFRVLADSVLDVYERTVAVVELLRATKDGPLGPDGAPLFRAGEVVGTHEVSLLDFLATRVREAQRLTLAERRALPGLGVAGP